MVNPIIYAGIGVGIAIAIFGILAGMDVNSAEQLQFMLAESEGFRFLDLSMDSTYTVCNPTDFPTSFEKIEGKFFYRSTELGTFTTNGGTFQPHIAKDVYGRANVNGQNVFQLFLGAFLSTFAGQELDLDPNDVTISLKVDKKILGIIPVTTEKLIKGGGMSSYLLDWEDYEKWGCGYSPAFKQRMKALGWNTELSFQENMRTAKINKIFNQAEQTLKDIMSSP